jgi:hypothetical protein
MKRVTVNDIRRRRVRSTQLIETVDHRKLLGPAPIIDGESVSDYEEFYASIRASIKPKDSIDEIFVRDTVDLAWEAARLRRMKAKLVKARMARGIETILRPIYGQQRAEKLAGRWAAGDRQAIKKINGHLELMGLDLEAVASEALCADIRDVEAMDRLAMMAEQRRNNALREVERRRGGFGAALRRASDNIIDAEFQDAPPAPRIKPPVE